MKKVWEIIKDWAAHLAAFFVAAIVWFAYCNHRKKAEKRYRDRDTRFKQEKKESLTKANSHREHSRVTEQKIEEVQQQIEEIAHEKPDPDADVSDLVDTWNGLPDNTDD